MGFIVPSVAVEKARIKRGTAGCDHLGVIRPFGVGGDETTIARERRSDRKIRQLDQVHLWVIALLIAGFRVGSEENILIAGGLAARGFRHLAIEGNHGGRRIVRCRRCGKGGALGKNGTGTEVEDRFHEE